MVKNACGISTACFILSNILGIAYVAKGMYSGYNEELWQALDSDYLTKLWEYRRSASPLYHQSSVLNAFAWLFLLVPILQLSFTLSRNGKRKVGIHIAIAIFAIVGCFTEVTSRTLFLGAWSSAEEISSSFNLDSWVSKNSGDQIGWKSFEISWLITQGLLRWIDAFEWVCLFSFLTLIYLSVGFQEKKFRKFPMWWARLGLFIALFAIVDLCADLLYLQQHIVLARYSILVGILNTILLLPIWLISLSHYLPIAISQIKAEEENSDQIS